MLDQNDCYLDFLLEIKNIFDGTFDRWNYLLPQQLYNLRTSDSMIYVLASVRIELFFQLRNVTELAFERNGSGQKLAYDASTSWSAISVSR
jgi:hypothetical protein